MTKKPKFIPKIKRVKLNPEQAVLTCNCYMNSTRGGVLGYTWDWMAGYGTYCIAGTRTNELLKQCAFWKEHLANDGVNGYIPSSAIS